MQEELNFPEKREYAVTVENLHFKLLVNKIGISRKIRFFDNAMHTHSHIELFVCTKGRILLNSPSGVIEVSCNDIAIVPKDYLHNRIIEENDDENEWYEINVAYSKRRFRSEADLYSHLDRLLDTDCIRVIKNKGDISKEIKEIYRDACGNNPSYPAIRAASALARLASEYDEADLVIECREKPSSSEVDISLLYKLNHIINSCFMKNYTNSQIAEMLFISERQLSRIASRHYGMTVRNAIIEKRVNSAEMLLSGTDDSTESIGASVGFKSKSAFYREFRKKYGLSPNEYRRKKAKENSDEPI